MMPMLERECEVDYIFENVVPKLHTAIFEVKCLTWAYQQGHAVILFLLLS